MIDIAKLTRQMLLASALVVTATGEAGAQISPLAAITQTRLPYFAFPQAVNSKPLGQFALNTRVCLTGKTYTWNGIQFFQYVLTGGELVYTPVGKGIFALDPAGDKRCMSQVASTTLPANIPPPVQRARQPAPNFVAPSTMAPSGEASAQRTKEVTSRRQATAPFFAVIAKASPPYYRGKNFGVVYNTRPVGQFSANEHLCANFKLTWKGREIVNIELPAGGNVYAVYSTENFIPDPANNQKCLATYRQYVLERSGSAPATQAKSSVAGNGTDAGALENARAAEKRGDWKAANSLLAPLAAQGNAQAQTELGVIGNKAFGTPTRAGSGNLDRGISRFSA